MRRGTMRNDSTNAEPTMTIEDAMARQVPVIGGFICEHCEHYRGKMKCEKNIFISCVGANMKGCWGYEYGIPKKCPATE